MDDIGDIVAQSILNFLADDKNKRHINDLLQRGVLPESEVGSAAQTQGVLSGETIVFTGALSVMTRSQARESAEALGAQTTDSVSKKTTLVVAGENAGSKLAKAEKLGIKVITEQAYIDLIGRDNLQ